MENFIQILAWKELTGMRRRVTLLALLRFPMHGSLCYMLAYCGFLA
jgi:hypothetical protein